MDSFYKAHKHHCHELFPQKNPAKPKKLATHFLTLCAVQYLTLKSEVIKLMTFSVMKLLPVLFNPADFYTTPFEFKAAEFFRRAETKPQALCAGSDTERWDSSLRKHFLLNRLLHPTTTHLLELPDHSRLGSLEVLGGHLAMVVGWGLNEVTAP